MIIGHKKQQDFLRNNKEKLSHAYLFSGPSELGKRTLAVEFLKEINCIYPDCMLVEGDSEIPIGKVREIQKFLGFKPYYGSLKAVIVDNVEKMNFEAQSCFLKTLEEPKGNTLLILVTSKPEMLLPTIVSRCQIIKFFQVKKSEIEGYLEKQGFKNAKGLAELSEGRPGKAMKADPEKEEKELNAILKVCDSDLAQRFNYAKTIPEETILEKIIILKNHLRKTMLSDKKAVEAVKTAELMEFKIQTTNVNPKLALEILLMKI